MKFLALALALTHSAIFADAFKPTYPCLEFSVQSSCAKFPFLAPAPDTSKEGTQVKCELKTSGFSSMSTQRQLMQQDCVYGECKPIGYGFIFYLTHRTLSSPDAPRILLSTQEFVKDAAKLDTQEVSVSFNPSPAFFNAGELVNKEQNRLNPQAFKVSIKNLLEGVTRELKIGVVNEDKTVSEEEAEITCTAKR